MKICSHCKEKKELSEFHKGKHSKDGLNYWCKRCAGKWSKEHPEEKRNSKLKFRYGITFE